MEVIITWTRNTVILQISIKASLQVESITTFMYVFKDTVARKFWLFTGLRFFPTSFDTVSFFLFGKPSQDGFLIYRENAGTHFNSLQEQYSNTI